MHVVGMLLAYELTKVMYKKVDWSIEMIKTVKLEAYKDVKLWQGC